MATKFRTNVPPEKRSTKKTMLLVYIGIAAVIILLLAVLIIAWGSAGGNTHSGETLDPYYGDDFVIQTNPPDFVDKNPYDLAIPDYDADIFKDEYYLQYVNDPAVLEMTVIENGYEKTVTDGNFKALGEDVDFFARYIEALRHGDAQLLNSFYDKSYFNDERKPFEKITMQPLYDIELEILEEKEHKSYYGLRYTFLWNDGTFRDNVKSGGSRVQYYELTEANGEYKITDVQDNYIWKETTKDSGK